MIVDKIFMKTSSEFKKRDRSELNENRYEKKVIFSLKSCEERYVSIIWGQQMLKAPRVVMAQ